MPLTEDKPFPTHEEVRKILEDVPSLYQRLKFYRWMRETGRISDSVEYHSGTYEGDPIIWATHRQPTEVSAK